VDLVIGARSALFAPLPRLGLIIVDEEHDTAYVQTGSRPPYCARDAAVVRARLEGAVVVLGSGTPSVQSFQNAKTSRYRLLRCRSGWKSAPCPAWKLWTCERSRMPERQANP
jgi:primosomal protein N' (replication factor Y)